jgi:gamma-glutamyltranspeptidase/glutathione hydrolase
MMDILNPAIELAEGGFPVSPVISLQWTRGQTQILKPGNPHGRDLLYEGSRSPRAGEIMYMPHLANTFKVLATEGKRGFYQGQIARRIVDVVQSNGGTLRMEDLESHFSTYDNPVKTNYRGINVWEMPPNGQGLTALMALNILSGFDFGSITYGSQEYWHLVIEALRLSFADTKWYVTDPAKVNCPVDQLLSSDYADKRRRLIQPDRAMKLCEKGAPVSSSDTVYFTVADKEGNACSFINSNYMGFGTGLVPEACGFTLQNRGANFSLNPSHPNALAPGKRPYHTIIPGMATRCDSEELYASFGVMGGFMQPQGHVQVLLNMIDYGMDPQTALDVPRVCIGEAHSPTDSGSVSLEDGIPVDVQKGLEAMGHQVTGPLTGFQRSLFGRGQIIQARTTTTRNGPGRVWWAGSEGRTDGLAIGY